MKKWVCTILLAAFACILFTGCTEGLFSAKDYKEYIFDKDVITINISTTEEDWQYLMDNALSKPYINADVDIDGTVFKAVGLKTKGNSTLTSVVNSDSERYSLKLNFDKYADGQECYGLDSLVLNNVYSDPSYLKEYLSYELLDYMEVPSSLHTFAEIYVNGEYYGFFIAIEDVKDSYLQRNYGEAYTGEAYKPESLEMADEADIGFGIMDDIGNKFNDNFGRTEFNFTSFLTLVDSENNEIPWDTVLPENFNADTIASVTYGDGSVVDIDTMNFMMLNLNGIVSLTDENGISVDLSGYTLKLPMNMPGMDGKAGFPGEQDNPSTMQPDNNGVIPENPIEGRGGMNGGTLGVDLVYTDDNPESYANIFDNAITKTDEEDETRLIETLKAISEGENLGEYIDIDEVLRYTAVNVFLTNLDSYLSNMGHNYCLYDEDGRLTILPWDYNLSFGTFGLGSSSEAVNYPIDTVFNGVDSSSRPIIGALIENQEYLEIYHKYLSQLVKYVTSGKFDDKVDKVANAIDSYVKNDKTAFTDYDEFLSGIEALKKFADLRAKSVAGQLDGSIPSTDEEQTSGEGLVDASGFELSLLGGMGNGDKGGMNGGFNGNGMPLPNGGDMMPGGNQPTAPDINKNP